MNLSPRYYESPCIRHFLLIQIAGVPIYFFFMRAVRNRLFLLDKKGCTWKICYTNVQTLTIGSNANLKDFLNVASELKVLHFEIFQYKDMIVIVISIIEQHLPAGRRRSGHSITHWI